MPPSHTLSPTTPLSRRLSQWICGVHGHDAQLQIGADRLRLRCNHCGYASPGWVVGRPAQEAQLEARRDMSAPSRAPATTSAQ
jgi:hypothetical protein